MKRKAFTMVDLVASIAVVAALISVAIPAICKAREAGYRYACTNNLKQIGVAWGSHQSMLGKLPSAGNYSFPTIQFKNGAPKIANEQHAGWGYQILPYIGEEWIWKGGDMIDSLARNDLIKRRSIKMFACPSRRIDALHANNLTHLKLYAPWCPGIDYAANLGNSYQQEIGEDANGWFFDTRIYLNGVIRPIFAGGSLTLGEITDGLSNTLLIGDKSLNLYYLGQSQMDDDCGYYDGYDWDVLRLTSIKPNKDANVGEYRSVGNLNFGSSHSVGYQAVFADCSVRTISYCAKLQFLNNIGSVSQRISD